MLRKCKNSAYTADFWHVGANGPGGSEKRGSTAGRGRHSNSDNVTEALKWDPEDVPPPFATAQRLRIRPDDSIPNARRNPTLNSRNVRIGTRMDADVESYRPQRHNFKPATRVPSTFEIFLDVRPRRVERFESTQDKRRTHDRRTLRMKQNTNNLSSAMKLALSEDDPPLWISLPLTRDLVFCVSAKDPTGRGADHPRNNRSEMVRRSMCE
eukprot:GEMP01069020.1.p1 GENE.GEMP01069020.1~~GEMP01069020.1.p1  ORF type:complete len:211 (+),score=38.85 GEMP01069020.1:196-828(+)